MDWHLDDGLPLNTEDITVKETTCFNLPDTANMAVVQPGDAFGDTNGGEIFGTRDGKGRVFIGENAGRCEMFLNPKRHGAVLRSVFTVISKNESKKKEVCGFGFCMIAIFVIHSHERGSKPSLQAPGPPSCPPTHLNF